MYTWGRIGSACSSQVQGLNLGAACELIGTNLEVMQLFFLNRTFKGDYILSATIAL